VRKYKHIVFFAFIVLLGAGCSRESTPSSNYISLEGQTFKDGASDFYPMVMNYSLDVHSKTKDSSVYFFATPRSGYHPNYGEGENQTTSPWGDDSAKSHAIINAHFASIKDMGFNTLRLTGFTSVDYYNGGKGFHTWSKIDVSNTKKGNENLINGLIPLMREIIRLAEANKLRVILLLSAVETQPNNQINFYSKIAESLKSEKALMAYDLYNEPLYFDRGNYSKKQTKAFVESYNRAIKEKSPNHLTTIGLSHYKIVSEWDPELMDVDFLSFHIYPYGSQNLSKLERFDSKLFWISQTITKPWIIGETGLNTAENCEPLNFSSGNYNNQLSFMNYSLNKNRAAGASGYSWWCFQDMKFPPGKIEGNCEVSDYGLVNRKKRYYLNSKKDTIMGILKHDISKLPFDSFASGVPYNSIKFDSILFHEEVYYNIDYLPTHKNAIGKVLNKNKEPIKNAIVTIYNTESKSTYTTFTRRDGSFDLKTGWTNVFSKPDFKLKVTAVKMETIEVNLKEIYSGKGNRFKDIVLAPYF